MADDDSTNRGKSNGFDDENIDEFVDRLIEGDIPPEEELTDFEQALVEISLFSVSGIEIGGSSVVERMVAEIRDGTEVDPASEKAHHRGYLARLVGAKAIIAATTAVALTGTAAAAASGALPNPIQHAFSAAASNLGVSIPSPREFRVSLAPNKSSKSQAGSSSGSGATQSNSGGISNSAAAATSTSTTAAAPINHSAYKKSSNCSSQVFIRLDSFSSLNISTTTTTEAPTTTTTTEAPTTTTTTEAPTTTTTTNPSISVQINLQPAK